MIVRVRIKNLIITCKTPPLEQLLGCYLEELQLPVFRQELLDLEKTLQRLRLIGECKFCDFLIVFINSVDCGFSSLVVVIAMIQFLSEGILKTWFLNMFVKRVTFLGAGLLSVDKSKRK